MGARAPSFRDVLVLAVRDLLMPERRMTGCFNFVAENDFADRFENDE